MHPWVLRYRLVTVPEYGRRWAPGPARWKSDLAESCGECSEVRPGECAGPLAVSCGDGIGDLCVAVLIGTGLGVIDQTEHVRHRVQAP